MKFVFSPAIFALILFHSAAAFAQLDSSYELLLGSAAGTPASTAKPPVDAPAAKSAAKNKRDVVSEGPATNVEIPQDRPLPVKLEPVNPLPPKAEEPTISQQAQSLFSATPEKVLGFYQEQFSEEDPRQNKVEISFAPGFVTNESSSNYSYRNFRSVYTAMNLGASVWLTPAIGMGGNFLFSLGADTSGDAVTNVRSPSRYELLDVAMKFRQFFGFTETSRAVQFDIIYSDHKMSVNSDDLYRPKLKSSGLGLKMTLRLPASRDVAWYLGGSFFPRLQHTESPTGAEIKSGSGAENVRIGMHFGSEIKLSRQSQIFFETSVSSEKNVFTGNANLPDPATGTTPKNVSVTDTSYNLSLGYRWGN